MQTKNTELFSSMPVRRAVIKMAIPTILSELITMIYNMADTFFIGQLNNADQVAAATICMPPFVMLTCIANLYGIGGASVVARSLGNKQPGKAKQCATFCIWASAASALIYGMLFLLFGSGLLRLLGANQTTFEYSYQYIQWTIIYGGVPTVLNATLAHIVRSEGYSKEAGWGVTLGCLLNMSLDPIFIFTLGMEIKGAAIATMISNVVSLLYFAVVIHKKQMIVGFSMGYIRPDAAMVREIFLTGFPSFVMRFLGLLSNAIVNNLMASYCNEAIAGMGIAKKIDMIILGICNGVSQGVLSLLAYNYAGKNLERMFKVLRTSLVLSMGMVLIVAVIIYAFAPFISELFIDDILTVEYSKVFLRTICVTAPLGSIIMLIISLFQATGQKKQILVLTLIRKGGSDIPFILLLNYFVGVYGIAWSTPIADVVTLVSSIAFARPFIKKLKQELNLQNSCG